MLEPKGNCSPVRKELRWFFYVLITRTFLKTVYNTSETAAQSVARNKPDGGRYSAIVRKKKQHLPIYFDVSQLNCTRLAVC